MKELLEAGVATDLKFYDKNNVLAGKTGTLGVVIKENNETKSYGVLMWVKAPADAAPNELSDILSKQVSTKPHIIKHFKATGRGAALALVKYNGAGRNIKNIKRFMTELSDELTDLGFSNCCYQCGSISDLAIYQDGASIVQLCPRCKKGELLCNIGTSPAPKPRPVPEKPAEAPEDKPLEPKKEEKPVEPKKDDKPVEVKKDDKPAETKKDDKPAEPKKDDKQVEVKKDDKPAETKKDDKPVEEKKDDKPAETKNDDKPAEPKKDDKPVEVKKEDKPAEPDKSDKDKDDKKPGIAGVPEELLADTTAAAAGAVDTDKKIISSKDDKTDISSLMADEKPAEEKKAPPKSEIFEAAQREFDEQKRSEKPEKDEALDSLMFDANAKKEEEKPAPWGGMPVTEAPKDNTDINGLMYDGTEAPEEETKPDDTVEKVGIGGLMLDADSVAEAEGEDYTAASAAAARAGATVTEVTELDVGGGTGEDIVVTAADDEAVGESSEVEVTALYDDSDEGIDIEIEESVSEFGMPTDTSGEPIVSTEKSDEEETAPKGRKPMEVRAFAYGSYENATAAEEPVGFDGRRKEDKIAADPRMGDEMGSRSRNYAAQQAASPIHDVSKVKAPTVVEKRAPAGSKTNPKRYSAYTTSSNALVGTVGALLFGLIAGAIWVLSGNLFDAVGMDAQVSLLIQSILGALIPVGAFLGYRVGGDAFDGKGIVISSVVSVVLGCIGYVAVLVTAEVRSTEAEYAYSISLDTAINNVSAALGDLGSHPDMVQRIGISAAALIIALVVSIIVAKKKSV